MTTTTGAAHAANLSQMHTVRQHPAVDNCATVWARKLIGNGADPHTIVAWMRAELDADPLAFAGLMTDREIALVRLRQISRKAQALTPAIRGLVPVIRRLNAALAAAMTGHPTGMPAEVEASITNALKEIRP